MGLRLIYGRAGTGKSYRCLQEIKKMLHIRNSGPLLLIVPEQYTLQAEKNLVETIGSTGIIGAEVMSFRRIAHRVFNEVGGLTRKTVDPAGKAIILGSIIENLKDELEIFSRSARKQGFVSIISEIISEFKRYGHTPEDLKQAVGQLAEKTLLKGKLKELSKIYGAFEETLGKDYMDSDDHLTLLAKKIKQCSFFEGAHIYIDGFSGFTPQEYSVIGELLQKAHQVNVCLCTDDIEDRAINEFGIFSPVAETVSRLMHIAKEKNVPLIPPAPVTEGTPYRFINSNELAHLEREYFNFPCDVYKEKTSDISIFVASNIYSEVEDAARDILRLCRDKGLRYRDIAVAARDPGAYNKLIGCVFGEYDIPCFIDGKKDILSNPFILFIVSVFDILIHNWSYPSVFNYLKTGLTDILPEDVDVLENYVLGCGIKGSAWTADKDWNLRMEPILDGRDISDNEREMLYRVNRIRKAVFQSLSAFYADIKGEKSVRDICAALYDFLLNGGVPGRIRDRIHRLDESGELNIANEYRQIWNIVMEVLDQMAETIGDDCIDVKGFKRLLESGLNEHKIGLIPPALDQVLIADVSRSKSHDIKALYVLGINDGVFPASLADEGILCDRDRENLRLIGMELAHNTRVKTLEEQYLIYNVLTTPSEYLRLSYPMADHKGRALRPSAIITRTKKLFPAVTEHSDIAGHSGCRNALDMISAPLPTFNRLISNMGSGVMGSEAKCLWADAARWYDNNREWRDRYNTMLAGFEYSNQTESIAGKRAKCLYGSPLYTNISRLERFAACPFAYFIEYGLRAKGRKEFELTAPDRGTFMHSVIDRFSKGMGRKGITWRDMDKEWCRREISAIVEDMLEENSESVFGSSPRHRYLTIRLKRILTRAVQAIAEHIIRGDFEPFRYELTFGGNGDFSPILLKLSSGERVYLSGRIDRVDLMKNSEGTYVRVIDYKSGIKRFSLSDLYYGLQMQLVTYLAALLENNSGDLKGPVLPAGFLYFPLEDPIITNKEPMTLESIETEILKKLKMNGLVLADAGLIKRMDSEINGNSVILPVRINKDGTLGKSSSTATLEQFNLLYGYIRGFLKKTAEEMLSGNISIAPYKSKGFTPCSYCGFSAICRFDTAFADNRYRVFEDIKDEQVWNLLAENEKSVKGGII